MVQPVAHLFQTIFQPGKTINILDVALKLFKLKPSLRFTVSVIQAHLSQVYSRILPHSRRWFDVFSSRPSHMARAKTPGHSTLTITTGHIITHSSPHLHNLSHIKSGNLGKLFPTDAPREVRSVSLAPNTSRKYLLPTGDAKPRSIVRNRDF
jgi:hypothetical protein